MDESEMDLDHKSRCQIDLNPNPFTFRVCETLSGLGNERTSSDYSIRSDRIDRITAKPTSKADPNLRRPQSTALRREMDGANTTVLHTESRLPRGRSSPARSA